MKVHLKSISQIRVRYAETDKMGFAYNGNYLTYFEIGRTDLMRAEGIRYRDLEDAGYQLPVLEASVKYLNSAFYDDLLSIESELCYDRGATLKFEYNIFRDDTIIAKGFTLHMFIKVENKMPVKPPKVFLDALEKISLQANAGN